MALDIEEHYRRFGPMVLRRCRTLLRNDAQAEDAMHDVFVAVLRAEDRLRDEAPAGLLLRVATNVCLNRLRTQRRRPEDADDALLSRIAGRRTDGVEARASARNLLARLFGADDPLAASTATPGGHAPVRSADAGGDGARGGAFGVRRAQAAATTSRATGGLGRQRGRSER